MNIFHELGIRDGKDRINEEVIYNVARIYTLIDNFVTTLLSPYDLSPAKFNIMLAVKHIGKETGIAQNEISRHLLVTTSNMTRMIDKLENEGYVERTPQKGDRRVNLIRITKKGSDLLDKIWPHYKKGIDQFIESKISKADKKQINQLMEKFTDSIKEGQNEKVS